MAQTPEINIENLPRLRNSGALGLPIGLTRVQSGCQGCEVSTVRYQGGWYETVAFPLDGQGSAMEPMITNTRPLAERIHEFAVQVAALALQTK